MVKSLGEYVLEVERLFGSGGLTRTTTFPWFRGQADATWNLTPSLYRGGIRPDREREIVRDFKMRSTAFLQSPPECEIEWLFVMQHHDLPTRLLDWSESAMTALYFAVCDFESTVDATVWVMNPWSLNKPVLKDITVPPVNHPVVLEYVLDPDPEKFSRTVNGISPIAIRPRRTTNRIVAQQGMFTIHGSSKNPLDIYMQADSSMNLQKILIDGRRKGKIFRELFLAGTRQSVIFPDIVGLAREIGIRYSDRFMNI